MGLHAWDPSADPKFVYNNTVLNIKNTASVGWAIGISQFDATVTAKNNFSGDVVSTPGNENCYRGAGAGSFTQSTNVSSDATASPGPVIKTAYASYFVNASNGTENLHLRSDTNALWGSYGDPSAPVTDDIDMDVRDASTPDIGADEFSTALYRSVGITATALASGAANALTISGSTATFASALPNNIGLGDAIQYDSDGNSSIDAIAFIHGRRSSTEFVVKNAAGSTATAVAGDNDWTLYRAYTKLANWESQTENTNINGIVRDFDTSTDLVSGNTVMMVACYADGEDIGSVFIDGWTTGPDNYIRIFTPVFYTEVGTSQRHNGVWSTSAYRLSQDASYFAVMGIRERYVRIDGLQLNSNQVVATQSNGIQVTQNNADLPAEIQISNNIIRSTTVGPPLVAFGIGALNQFGLTTFDSSLYVAKVWNNIVYGYVGTNSSSGIYAQNYGTLYVYNNTIVGTGAATHRGIVRYDNTDIHAKNNISIDSVNPYQGVFSADSTNNFSDVGVAPGLNPKTRDGAGADPVFVGGVDYHLHLSDTWAQNQGADLSSDSVLAFGYDIDRQSRVAPWDIGADDALGTTAVKLMSFEAVGADGAVDLRWQTGSELNNLGFHLHRSTSANGSYARITSTVIPGLGSSPVGASYSYRDMGLRNGTRYFYRLEDVDTSSKTTSHGPVSAVPVAGAGGATGSESPDGSPSAKKKPSSPSCPDWVVAAYGSVAGSSASTATLTCTRRGDPEAVSLGVLSRDARSATLELRTGGFYALREASGRVRVFVPGFDFPQDPQAAALPFRRVLVDAVVGRRAQLGGVRALDQVAFPGLVPASLGKAEMQVSRDGTVRAGRRAIRELAPQHVSSDLARLLPSVFQGEAKRAVVQITPLRFDARRQQIVLSKRVLVKLLFTGRETGESGRGGFGRRGRPQSPVTGEVLARLYTTSRGLYAVSFEQLFPGRSGGFAASQLRLERQGYAQGFHFEPASDGFGPGSVLYFHADTTASASDFSSEVAWELVRSRDGLRMPLVSAAPAGDVVSSAPLGTASFEVNRIYQPGLLEAPELWLWEGLASGATRAKGFSLSGVDAASSRTAGLEVFLQGASESGQPVDHHVSVSLNGTLVGEAQFAGKKPYRVSQNVPVSLLHEGANEISLTNVADTGVSSFVFLDRFSLAYPQDSSLATGVFEGTWAEGGTATLSRTNGPVAFLDVTATPLWLYGYEPTGGSLRFRAEAGHRYLAVSQQALLSPRVAAPAASTLRSTQNQADYLLIAPRAFLAAAEPLVQRRADQGLQARAVAFEEIVDEFGRGQPSAEAIKAFLGYAFHSWTRPSPRYVLLLGDANYDPHNFTGTSQPSPLPVLWTKTSYLWTASDPQLAAVNGEDSLPDLAIGRLPATTVAEAEALVRKLLAWEDSGQGLNGRATLVADNPDLAGDFEADIRDIAESYLAGRSDLLLLSELGAQTRPRILDALNSGLSYLGYVGHGGAAVWASENVWNSWDAARLQTQSEQPMLVTMNCLNGYFVAPAFNSLSESLLKAEGRGAIASFSPSGLSLDGPAHQYHRALMAALTSGQHQRLGDAVLAAQRSYALTGSMPELLDVYHLFGDPAMKIR